MAGKTRSRRNKTSKFRRTKRLPRKGTYYSIKATPQTLTAPAMFVKLKYRYKLNVTATTKQHFVMRLNSMYDPVHAVGGGQPMGFDQLSALYNKFIVYGCKVRLRASQYGSVPSVIAMAPQKSSIYGASTIDELQERPYAKTAILTAERPVTLTAYYAISALEGISKSDILGDDGDFGHSASTDPIRGQHLVIANNPVDLVSGTTVYYDLEMLFYAKAYENKALSRS